MEQEVCRLQEEVDTLRAARAGLPPAYLPDQVSPARPRLGRPFRLTDDSAHARRLAGARRASEGAKRPPATRISLRARP